MPALFVAKARTKYLVPGDNLESLLVKLPTPIPSLVQLSTIVGDGSVLQQTPLANMSAPPLLSISPPQMAVILVIVFTLLVVIAGSSGSESVLNDFCLLYPTPTLFLANERI